VVVLAFTSLFMGVEVAGSLLTGSLALLADAGHMATDVAALALALGASLFSERGPSPRRSYGYYRAEILAALLSGVFLLLVVAYILYEASQRFVSPPPVRSGPMLVVAVVGLGVNVLGASLLGRVRATSLNLKGAFFHVLGDLLGSVGAILAAVIMLTTGIFLADPIISVVIALAILLAAWRLLRQTTDVLMESVPEHIDLEEVRAGLLQVPGVRAVHDLHVWTLTTGFVAMSGHVVADLPPGEPDGYQRLLLALREQMKRRFAIDHATLQVEVAGLPDEDVHFSGDPRCQA